MYDLLTAGATQFFQSYLPDITLHSNPGIEWKEEADYLWGSITIQAREPIYIRILIPEQSAITLLNESMGGNATNVNPMVVSAVSELLNTIGGSMKVTLSKTVQDHMELGLPIVHSSITDPHPDPFTDSIHFHADEKPIAFWCTVSLIQKS